MKKSLLVLFLLSSFCVYSQDSTISGVVTYFFNKYQGDKPDIGAKVYVIDSIGNNDFDYESINQLRLGKTYISLYNSYSNLSLQNEQLLKLYGNKKKNADLIKSANEKSDDYKKEMDKFHAEMIKYNVETDEKLKELDKKVSNSYRKTIHKEDLISRSINANGDYSIPVNAGTYYVFIVSKNRTGSGMSEVMGKIFCEKVKIKSGQTKDISCNFNVN